MKKPELQAEAAKGSKEAQDELDRRVARREASGGKIGGKRTGIAFNPPKVVSDTAHELKPEEGHTGTYAELDKSHPMGAQAYVKGFGLGTIVQHHPAMHDNTAVTVDVPGHGLIKRTIDQVQVGKNIPASALAAKARREAIQVETNKRIAESQKRRELSSVQESEALKKAAEQTSREASKNLPAGYTSEPQSSRGTYHNVMQKSTGNKIGQTMEGTDYSRRSADGSRLVGPESAPKVYRATYMGKIISTHDSREDATKAVIAAHQVNQAKTEVAATRRMNLSKRVAAGTAWQATTFDHDSSPRGMEAAQKIKQAYQMGNHKVLIEPSLTKDQTQELLKNISTVIHKTGTEHTSTSFHVPTGDTNFRQKQRGSALGYVRPGQDTVFINPRLATGESAHDFGRNTHLMQAAQTTPGQQYVLAHELGHIKDIGAGDTRQSAGELDLSGGQKLSLGVKSTEKAKNLMQANRTELSTYGNKSSTEAYAEAYAQWIHGGPGSSKVADEYAKEFGWAPPSKI